MERCLRGFGWDARRCKWEDNMKMDLREIGIDGVNWIYRYFKYTYLKNNCKMYDFCRVPMLFLTDHHSMKAYWGRGGIAPRIL
jgi:hypothetical protein